MSDDSEPAPRQRSFTPTVLGGLAGAALATAAATRDWAQATANETGPRTVVASGVDVAPTVLPFALVALAAWGTVLVLRSAGRRVVSVLAFVAAVAAAVVAAVEGPRAADVAAGMLGEVAASTTSTSAWPYVAVLGCVVSALASAVAFVRAPAWPEMSTRYDAPGNGSPAGNGPVKAEGATGSSADMWKAMDSGEDPTT